MFLEKFYSTLNRFAEFLLNLSPSGFVFSDRSFALIVFGIIFSGLLLCAYNLFSSRARSKNDLYALQEEEIEHLTKKLLEGEQEKSVSRLKVANLQADTGNLVSAIIEETALLKLKADDDLQPVIENILRNSTRLYEMMERSEHKIHPEKSRFINLYQ